MESRNSSVQIPTVPWTQQVPSNHYRFIFLEHPSSPPLSNQSLEFKCHLLFPRPHKEVYSVPLLHTHSSRSDTQHRTEYVWPLQPDYQLFEGGNWFVFFFSLGSWQSACDLVHVINFVNWMNINNETVFRANAIVPTCIQSLSHLLPHPPTRAMLLLPISLRKQKQ